MSKTNKRREPKSAKKPKGTRRNSGRRVKKQRGGMMSNLIGMLFGNPLGGVKQNDQQQNDQQQQNNGQSFTK
jgi:hypothetical protein